MTREELSLLLFLETQAVDYRGNVDVRHMNGDDHEIARQWVKRGYIEFGRLPFKECRTIGTRNITHRVRLSDQAHADAGIERTARARRNEPKAAAK